MKKITELTEFRYRTIHIKDSKGNRKRSSEKYIAKRPVKSIKPGPRLGHFIVDFIVFRIIIEIISFLLQLLSHWFNFSVEISLTLGLITSIFLLQIYPALYALCEIKWQRTPGKFLTKSRVIDEYGNKPERGAIILRSIIRIIPFEPFSCIGDNYSHGWHDRWANTWVVTDEEWSILKKLQAEQSEATSSDQ